MLIMKCPTVSPIAKYFQGTVEYAKFKRAIGEFNFAPFIFNRQIVVNVNQDIRNANFIALSDITPSNKIEVNATSLLKKRPLDDPPMIAFPYEAIDIALWSNPSAHIYDLACNTSDVIDAINAKYFKDASHRFNVTTEYIFMVIKEIIAAAGGVLYVNKEAYKLDGSFVVKNEYGRVDPLSTTLRVSYKPKKQGTAHERDKKASVLQPNGIQRTTIGVDIKPQRA